MAAKPNQSLARLQGMLDGLRQRWRIRRAMQGLAIWCVLAIVLGLISIVFLDSQRFASEVIGTTRSLYLGLLILSFVLLVPVRTLQWWPNLKLARYAEARRNKLDGALLTAVDSLEGRSINASPDLNDALIDRVTQRLSQHPADSLKTIENAAIKRSAMTCVIMLLLGALLLAASPTSFRFGAKLLAQPNASAENHNPYQLEIEPGNLSLLEGEDLRVIAFTRGFKATDIQLRQREPGDTAWRQTGMDSITDGKDANTDARFESFVFDVTQQIEYQVIADGIESDVFSVSLIPRPEVERIDLTYNYPKRTGRETERLEGASDIEAVKGTEVEITVTPDTPVEGGQIVVNGDQIVPLEKNEQGQLSGQLTLSQSGQYRVELKSGDDMMPASREHRIRALDDGLPVVRLISPASDSKVTSIEEVEFVVGASDDVAIAGLELVVSVNGGIEEIIELSGQAGTELTRAHLIMLEQRELAPGDLISYYARATDAANQIARRVSTDMYFLDVRPFEQSFREGQGAGGGGGGGGGGGQQQEDLSAQQRALVVALFKISRDRVDMDDEVASSKLDTLGEAQNRIRDRVDAIVRRLQTRRIVDETPGVKQMTDELPKASRAMRTVSARLETDAIDDALASARQALLHLQRADAAFREVQISQARRSGRGQNSATNDMSNLFRLEMDRFRNQYADLQRGQAERQQQQDLDDTMRKLREMSRRQIEELDRPATGNQGQGQGGTESQRRLAEQVEQLMRELKRLTRNKNDQNLKDSIDQLEQAAQAMREAGNEGDREAGERALEKLEQAREALEGENGSRTAGNEQSENADRLRQVMRGMQATREQMSPDRAGPGTPTAQTAFGDAENQRVPNTQARQDGDAEDLRFGMQQQIDALGPVADASRADNPDEARDIESVVEQLRGLRERVRDDEVAIRYGQALRELQQVEKRLREAGDSDRPVVIASGRGQAKSREEKKVDQYFRSLSDDRP